MSWQLALAVTAAVAVAWAAHVAVNPWRKCWSCKGTGKGRFSGGRYYGDCRACDGGRKKELRLGARFIRPDLRK